MTDWHHNAQLKAELLQAAKHLEEAGYPQEGETLRALLQALTLPAELVEYINFVAQTIEEEHLSEAAEGLFPALHLVRLCAERNIFSPAKVTSEG